MKLTLNHPSNHSKLSSTSGFTLIELLVVVALIGILSTIVIATINPARRIAETRDTQMKNDLSAMKNALEAYATANNGRYPTTGSQYWCEDCSTYVAQGKNNWIPELVSRGFIKTLPTSPLNGIPGYGSCSAANATYMYYSNGTNYKLFAHCMPTSFLNNGTAYKGSSYCTPRPPYDSSSFVDSTNPNTQLKSFVDPARPTYSYAVYSPGFTCL